MVFTALGSIMTAIYNLPKHSLCGLGDLDFSGPSSDILDDSAVSVYLFSLTYFYHSKYECYFCFQKSRDCPQDNQLLK